MSIESIQQKMRTVLEVIRGYHDLIGVRNTTTDRKKLKKIENELEKKKDYILGLLEKVKNLIEEEKENVKG